MIHMKKETRKDEILIASAKLFKDKGYSAVTMRDLAQTLGIKAASLYNHINSNFYINTFFFEFFVIKSFNMRVRCNG